MFEKHPNWPVLFFLGLVFTAAMLSFASNRGWIKLGRGGCCARVGCSKNRAGAGQDVSPAAQTCPPAEAGFAKTPVK